MSQPRTTKSRTGQDTTRAVTKAQRRERAAAARHAADLARQRAARRRRALRWGAGVVVAAVVLGGLYLIYDAGTERGSGGAGGASGYAYEVGDPGPGQPAPDFTLPATDGNTVSLSDFREQTVLLYFHEGSMCQPCFDQIRDLEREAGKLTDAGIDQLVTITVDPLDRLSQKMRDENLSSIALSDPDLAVSKQYTAEQYGMMGGTTPGHSFLLIDPDGVIQWRADYGGPPDFTMYLPVDAILADLRADTATGQA